jgi:hypothetical protein
MTDLKYPEWQAVYNAALLATDEHELFIKVTHAETAIVRRLQALAGNSDHHEERLAISDATATLRKLQVQKLKFPGSTEV